MLDSHEFPPRSLRIKVRVDIFLLHPQTSSNLNDQRSMIFCSVADGFFVAPYISFEVRTN